MSHVLFGVTGGIAAYKSLDVLRILQRRGHSAQVVMTRTATRFVGPASFAALSGRTVGLRQFEGERQPGYHHLDLVREADLMLVAPASANTIAKMAAGLADGLLTSCYLAFDGPVLVAPAMNTGMWLHPATAANIERLRAHGVRVVDPAEGLLADGAVGPGRLADPVVIADAVQRALAPEPEGDLTGVRVLVTAGGTREPIDSVRYVGNRSSGRMGLALAQVARDRGAQVTVVAANVALPRPDGVVWVEAPTAAAMHEATLRALPDHDMVVMAAAVADYRPAAEVDGKLRKEASDRLVLELERTDDILSDLAGRRNGQVMVGFAAEHGEGGLERAREKRRRKGLHALVYNDVAAPGIGFDAEDNAVTIIGPGEAEVAFPPMPKAECADRILDAITPLVTRGAAPA